MPKDMMTTRPAMGVRRFGRVNWLGFRTLATREVMRFMAVWQQTIFAPLMTAALFVLVFAPGSRPDPARIKARFRQLATIHHPDSGLGDTDRMTELNQAMSFTRGYEKH